LDVVRIEIAISVTIFWGISIQPTNDPRQNAQLLSSIIAHHSDLRSNLSKIRSQGQSSHRHIFDGFGIESKDTEIVDWVTVDRVSIDFFVIIEDAISPKGSSSDHMPIGHDVSERRSA
jgi:hypothetical protein